MEDKNVKSLSFNERKEHNGEKILNYAIEYEGSKTKIVSINSPLYSRPIKTDELTFMNKSFVNGFKVVRTKNGEYGYIREEDNCLLPYRYDIALDFNEYGLAMVGKDGYVTWINKNFEFLDSRGIMAMEQEEHSFVAFDKITAFSKGKFPLSLLIKRYYDVYTYRYMDTFGKIKSFLEYNKETGVDSLSQSTFPTGTPFNDQGYAKSGDYILNSKGYMIDKNYLTEICFENGFVDSVFDEIDQKAIEHGRTLKK